VFLSIIRRTCSPHGIYFFNHTGYIVDEELVQEYEKMNRDAIATKSHESYTQALRVYPDSFDNNQDEVVDHLRLSFKKASPDCPQFAAFFPVYSDGRLEPDNEGTRIEHMTPYYLHMCCNQKLYFDLGHIQVTFSQLKRSKSNSVIHSITGCELWITRFFL